MKTLLMEKLCRDEGMNSSREGGILCAKSGSKCLQAVARAVITRRKQRGRGEIKEGAGGNVNHLVLFKRCRRVWRCVAEMWGKPSGAEPLRSSLKLQTLGFRFYHQCTPCFRGGVTRREGEL